MTQDRATLILGGVYFGLWFWLMAAWMTHVIACFKAEAWGFLIAGALAFPVAWVHGTGIWFGAW